MLRMVQVRVFQRYYESELSAEIGLGALSALIVIRDNPGIRHGALADILLVRRPNMTKLVDGLRRSGLVARRSSSRDRRGVALFVTAKGRRMLARASALSRVQDDAATAALTPAERSNLLRLLRKMAATLMADPAWCEKP